MKLRNIALTMAGFFWAWSGINERAFSVEETARDEALVFIGTLKKTTLVPGSFSGEYCPGKVEDGDESCLIIVSNRCGTETMTFQVVQPILGQQINSEVTLQTSIGEWCEMSAKISEESQIVFAEELQTEWPEDGQEFSVYFFPVYQTKNSEKYFFLEHSSDFQMCGEITGLNCFSLLRMVEAEYFGSRESVDEMFKQRQAYLFEKKVLIEDDQGDFYLTQGIFVDDLVKAIEEKNQSR